jgi:spermidine synthase
LDIVEISREVAKASDFFIPWNHRVLSDPRTELILQDGRAHLELTRRKYDVISSEPSNPWMAGLAALFTEEFFSLARERLHDDGIFVQFIHGYQMDWPTFALVGRTFAHVFPNSLLVRTLGVDFLLVGLKGKRGLDEKNAEKNLKYAQKSRNITMANHRILFHLIINEDLKRVFGKGPLNTDDRPRLEFAAPRLMHTRDWTIPKRVRPKQWLRAGTRRIISEDMRDVQRQIDFAAFALSFPGIKMASQNLVNLQRATPSQRRRLQGIVEKHCKSQVVRDLSFVHDKKLRKTCLSVQTKAVEQRVGALSDKAPAYVHLGDLHLENGSFDEAKAYYSRALKIEPGNASAHFGLGNLHLGQHRTAEAITHYSEALKTNPFAKDVLNNLAWIFATQENAKFRNGERAVELALRASDMNGSKDASLLDTLAAAYAEAGQFDQARRTAEKAVALAQSRGDRALARKIEQRLTLYRSHRPFHEKMSSTKP